MKTLSSTAQRTSRTHGFSLVEVVLAVGIMALGVVTILGLLPHGLEMSRKTANEMAETRIVDTIVGELQSMSWSSLDEIQNETRFFDDQGLQLQQNDPDFGIQLSYVANVQVPVADVLLPSNVVLPEANRNLRRVVVKVVSAPLPQFNFANPTPGVPVKVFSQLISNTSMAF